MFGSKLTPTHHELAQCILQCPRTEQGKLRTIIANKQTNETSSFVKLQRENIGMRLVLEHIYK